MARCHHDRLDWSHAVCSGPESPVIVFYFGALVLTQVMVNSIFGKGFFAFNAGPKYVALALGSLLCRTVGNG